MATKKDYGNLYDVISNMDPTVMDLGQLEDGNNRSEQKFIHTGSYILNAHMSGSLFGGVPVGRITTISGDPKSGKSYLVYNLIREFQALGYFCILRDTENAVTVARLVNTGVDISKDKLLISEPETVEDMIVADTKLTDRLMEIKKKGGEIPKIAIFVDSITALNSEKQYSDARDGKTPADRGTLAKENHKYLRMMATRFGKLSVTMVATSHTWDKPIPGAPGATRKSPNTQGTGWIYMSSSVIMLTKKVDKDTSYEENAAGVKTKEAKGVLVTSNTVESRFAKPVPVSFYISFIKGMNPYLGLQGFISWCVCGVDKGSWKDRVDLAYELIYKKEVESADQLIGITFDAQQFEEILSKQKSKLLDAAVDCHIQRGELVHEDGAYTFTEAILNNLNEDGSYKKPDDLMPVVNQNCNTFIARHLYNKTMPIEGIFNKHVFTNEVLKQLDKYMQPYFKLPDNGGMAEEEDIASISDNIFEL